MEIKGFSDLQAVYRLRPEAVPKTSRRTEDARLNGHFRPPQKPLGKQKTPQKGVISCDFFINMLRQSEWREGVSRRN